MAHVLKSWSPVWHYCEAVEALKVGPGWNVLGHLGCGLQGNWAPPSSLFLPAAMSK
jgi:hypothetical protein